MKNKTLNYFSSKLKTTKSINDRFGNDILFEEKFKLKYNVKFIVDRITIQEAYEQEQFILSVFNSNRISINNNNFKTTEAFNKDVLKGYYGINL